MISSFESEKVIFVDTIETLTNVLIDKPNQCIREISNAMRLRKPIFQLNLSIPLKGGFSKSVYPDPSGG